MNNDPGDAAAFPNYEKRWTGPGSKTVLAPIGGMTLRQYYAGLAMSGLMHRLAEYKEQMRGPKDGQFVVDQLALDSVRAADALLEALSRPAKEGGER